MLPENFFVQIPGYFYEFVNTLNFFCFQYEFIGSGIQTYTYYNPYFNEEITKRFPTFGGSIGMNLLVEAIERFFGFDISITFFEFLLGPGLLIALVYGFIKYLIPV